MINKTAYFKISSLDYQCNKILLSVLIILKTGEKNK